MREKLTAFLGRVSSMIYTSAADLLFLGGLIVLALGCWLAWEPLGLIVFGGFICVPMLIHRMRGGPHA